MAIDSSLSLGDPICPELASPGLTKLLEVQVYTPSSDWGEGACCCRACNLVVQGFNCGCSSISESGVFRKREAISQAFLPRRGRDFEVMVLMGIVVNIRFFVSNSCCIGLRRLIIFKKREK